MSQAYAIGRWHKIYAHDGISKYREQAMHVMLPTVRQEFSRACEEAKMNNLSPQIGALSREEAARYLSLSVRHLDNMVAQGKLQKVKIGRKTLFRIVDLELFLKQHLHSNK